MFGHVIAALLIGIGANLDNAGVGLAFGIRRIRIPPLPNLNIAAIAVSGTLVTAVGGRIMERFIPHAAANIVGATVLIAIGLAILLPTIWPRLALVRVLGQPELADADASGAISLHESWPLGLALGANAWAGGLGSALIGLSPLLVAASIGLFSYLLLLFPARLGQGVGALWLGNKASIVAGVLLILVGMHQLV